ncbi:hypothetical protein ACS0PU_000605 [Formica fusca]
MSLTIWIFHSVNHRVTFSHQFAAKVLLRSRLDQVYSPSYPSFICGRARNQVAAEPGRLARKRDGQDPRV